MATETQSRAQELFWRLEALAYDVFAGVMRLLPVDLASDFGAWLFARVGPLTSSNRIVERNLRIAFPEISEAEVERLKNAQWQEAGRFFAEFPIVDRIARDPSRLEVVNRERLTAVAAGQGPVVLISGHFSNFEVMAAAIVQAGVSAHVSYRAANNPHFDRRVRESRARYGVDLLAAKGMEGTREMMRAFARGDSIALLNDQKDSGGVAAPFFGVVAQTAPGPAAFALKFGAPLLPMSVQRVRKARFRVIVHEPIVLEKTGDRTADIATAVRRINGFMEERVRERPAEWFWVHKRWPKEMYRKG